MHLLTERAWDPLPDPPIRTWVGPHQVTSHLWALGFSCQTRGDQTLEMALIKPRTVAYSSVESLVDHFPGPPYSRARHTGQGNSLILQMGQRLKTYLPRLSRKLVELAHEFGSPDSWDLEKLPKPGEVSPRRGGHSGTMQEGWGALSTPSHQRSEHLLSNG